MCRIIPLFIGPWEGGKAFSLKWDAALISLILLHARRWDPVFLSEKWEDNSRGRRGSGLSRHGPPPTSNRCRVRLKTCYMGDPMQCNAVRF